MRRPWSESRVLPFVVVLALGAALLGVKRMQDNRARDVAAAKAAAVEAVAAPVRARLFAAIQPVTVANCELARYGNSFDGGYVVCANLLGAVKGGYSYGVNGTDDWGCYVSRTHHVAVHEYDCFNLTEPSCPDGKLIFHPECVGTKRETQEQRPFDSLAGQFERNGDTTTPLVVKMDVEGAEWDAFLTAPDSVFEHIDQLIVEFHRVDEDRYVRAIERLKQFFVIANVHYNNFTCDPTIRPFPAWAFEALLVSKRLAKTDGTPAAPVPEGPLNQANDAKSPDCQAAGGS